MSDLHDSVTTRAGAGGNRIVERGDPDYPALLARTPDAPGRLEVAGRLAPYERAVAVVGSRSAGAEGLAMATAVARDLAAAGVLVVSGGAVGIDAAAHTGALEASGALGAGAEASVGPGSEWGQAASAGPGSEGNQALEVSGNRTWVVLGSGLGVPYPEANLPLFDRIVAGGGALLSQFPTDAPPRGGHFVRRNRTLAGLVDAVLVIDAGAGSGALHTARAAADYGRVVAAAPGSPGCDALIREGAAVASSAADVLAAVDRRPRRPEVELPAADSDPGRVLAALDRTPAGRDDIAVRVGLAPGIVARALVGLELDGLVSLLPGHHYIRSTLADELLVPASNHASDK